MEVFDKAKVRLNAQSPGILLPLRLFFFPVKFSWPRRAEEMLRDKMCGCESRRVEMKYEVRSPRDCGGGAAGV